VKKFVHPRLKVRLYYPNCKTTKCTYFITDNLKIIEIKVSVDINFMHYYILITLEFEVLQCCNPNIIDI